MLRRTAPRAVVVAFHEEFLGGATASVLRVVPLLEERGWRFAFWTARPSALYEDLTARGLDVHGAQRPVSYGLKRLRLPPGPARRLAGTPLYLGAFRRFVRERSPAFVHANSLYTLAEAAAARSAGARVLLHVHEIVPAGTKGQLAGRIAQAVADERVAVSRASAASMTRRSASVRVVYEGTPVPVEPAHLRPSPHPFVVGTVGSISRRKGSDVFVEAARHSRNQRLEIEFQMIGSSRDPIDPEWGERVLASARQLGVKHRSHANPLVELRNWDAFVLPSRNDPCPIAMLEAMSLGLPVIGTRVDGIPEQVTPGSGILVPPEDPEALARQIVALAGSSYEEREALGVAARRRVKDAFTLERQAEGLHRAYLGAAASGS